MCLITRTTYTSCIHTKVYTDRTAYHAYYFRSAGPEKCRKVQVNEVKIEGVCEGCLEEWNDRGDARREDGCGKEGIELSTWGGKARVLETSEGA
jgi:hypothetical protein